MQKTVLTPRHAGRVVALAIVAAAMPAAGQQYIPGGSGMSPAERALLWRFGTRSMNDTYFQRQLFAVQQQSRNDRMRNQQMLRQQYGAQMRAEAERQRIRSTMSPGRGRYVAGSGRTPRETPPQEQLDENTRSDLWFLWDELGVGCEPADPALVKAAAPQYTGGVVARAIRVDGPAEAANWLENDILVGLNGFQTKSNSDVAFVLEQPDLKRDKPLAALIVRSGKLFTSEILLAPSPPGREASPQVPPRLDEDSASGKTKLPDAGRIQLPPEIKGAKGAQSPPSSSGEPAKSVPPSEERKAASGRRLTAPPKVLDAPAPAPSTLKADLQLPAAQPAQPLSDEEKLLWQRLGVRVKSLDAPPVDKRYRGGLKIAEVRADSPAAKARWQPNDVLVGFHEYQISALDDLVFVVDRPDQAAATSVDYRLLRGRDLMVGKIDLPAR